MPSIVEIHINGNFFITKNIYDNIYLREILSLKYFFLKLSIPITFWRYENVEWWQYLGLFHNLLQASTTSIFAHYSLKVKIFVIQNISKWQQWNLYLSQKHIVYHSKLQPLCFFPSIFWKNVCGYHNLFLWNFEER